VKLFRALFPVFLLAVSGGCRRSATAGEKARDFPVVLISIDTLRADHVPCYGYAGGETPNLDAFRRDAILFQNAYSHCPLTLPSHLSMLTGLLPAEHGVRDNIGYRFDSAKHSSLPSLLRPHGYATGAAVSAFVLRGATGIGSAFDFFDDAIEGPVSRMALSEVQRPGAETVARSIAWLEKRRDGRFFFFLHLYEPHTPYSPPEPFRSRLRLPYDGEIAAADSCVGSFLQALKRLGFYDRALVVVT